MLYDCLIVGGGPAGLTAAIYLVRFRLSVMLVDAGESRARLIPLTRNHAGFPDGISGDDLLDRMRRQADQYGTKRVAGDVTALSRADDHFVVRSGNTDLMARTVLLATGVVNCRPPTIDDHTHDAALASGRLRYCPVCDGYEVLDQAVAVLGTGQRGFDEALFLRSFTADVTLIAPGAAHSLSDDQRSALTDADIDCEVGLGKIELSGENILLDVAGETRAFDCLYPALGSHICSELAGEVGADRSEDGCLTVDAHQRTNVEGLYAAGDVVLGLDQISHAMGEAGVAATTIRSDLAKKAPLRR
jgi:thioredoxin reductase (NADPH)